MTQTARTLADFQATREECADIGSRLGIDFGEETPTAGFIYGTDTYIQLNRGTGGKYFLILHRDSWVSDDLGELEALLYAFCITECPEEFGMQVDDNVHVFICQLQDWMGLDNFAAAIRANAAEECASVCHMHDHCDANAAALIAVQAPTEWDDDAEQARDWIADAAAVYEAARPYLRGGAA